MSDVSDSSFFVHFKKDYKNSLAHFLVLLEEPTRISLKINPQKGAHAVQLCKKIKIKKKNTEHVHCTVKYITTLQLLKPFGRYLFGNCTMCHTTS